MATRWFVLLSLILAGTDQITKAVALHELVPSARYEIIPDFFRLTLNFNKGIAWGMLPEWSEYFTYFAIIMVLVILMILRKLDKDEVWLKIALAFQMAGAIGNMTDRLIRHQVTDFLDVTLFPQTQLHYSWNLWLIKGQLNLPYDWPIFNLADSFVVIGTAVLVIVLAFTREAPRVQATAAVGGMAAGAASLDWNNPRGEGPRECGAIPLDEGLVEIPLGDECEGLVPLEEVDSVREDELGEPPAGDEAKSKPVLPGDQTKLNELSKWPER